MCVSGAAHKVMSKVEHLWAKVGHPMQCPEEWCIQLIILILCYDFLFLERGSPAYGGCTSGHGDEVLPAFMSKTGVQAPKKWSRGIAECMAKGLVRLPTH